MADEQNIPVQIDEETAEAAIELLGGLVSIFGIGSGVTAAARLLAIPAAKLAARLMDANYEVPGVDKLNALAEEVAALPDLGTD